ncbi:DNA polymerase subunit beta [Methanobacterium sp. CWC-01]|uniref:DNA polymerase subunit beta n=1 Tax=Methanobacterium aridiramus TaxID=2584467 RepID=UPI0025767B4C|nr:DNA polymerase subunit beta [Methanobacterium sp. CWC-01]WJI09672.1 DNA polymerase subunit beta [Methanobacterium sp. CWC-01]
MRARPRDFIYTRDDLFLATTTYLHPDDRILAFLRYVPKEDGERSRNNSRYTKVDSKQAYAYLNDFFPNYIFNCDVTQVEMMGAPKDRVKDILKPEERLKEIMQSWLDGHLEDQLLQKVVMVAEVFQDEAGISPAHMGISGSILPGLYDPAVSDIDFVIYGLENHRNAMEFFSEIKNDPDYPLDAIGEDYWLRLYEKRIKDSSLSFQEFQWYENRKNNRGVVSGTLFDILATRDWSEIEGIYGDKVYEPLGYAEIECTVKDSIASFDNPAVYEVEDVKILNGPTAPITQVASYTHTYAGQAVEGERILVKGKLERVTGKKTIHRLIVGTTRESVGEFIKLKSLKKS